MRSVCRSAARLTLTVFFPFYGGVRFHIRITRVTSD